VGSGKPKNLFSNAKVEIQNKILKRIYESLKCFILKWMAEIGVEPKKIRA
jgi:hypothetical protein